MRKTLSNTLQLTQMVLNNRDVETTLIILIFCKRNKIKSNRISYVMFEFLDRHNVANYADYVNRITPTDARRFVRDYKSILVNSATQLDIIFEKTLL